VTATTIRVLVIDDDPEYVDLIREVLEKEHIECATATSSQEGLVMAVSWHPDLILLDLILPDMSGFGYLRELKRQPEAAAIPVIVVTSVEDEEIAEVSRDLGAVAYLSKHCLNEGLISMVTSYAA